MQFVYSIAGTLALAHPHSGTKLHKGSLFSKYRRDSDYLLME